MILLLLPIAQINSDNIFSPQATTSLLLELLHCGFTAEMLFENTSIYSYKLESVIGLDVLLI